MWKYFLHKTWIYHPSTPYSIFSHFPFMVLSFSSLYTLKKSSLGEIFPVELGRKEPIRWERYLFIHIWSILRDGMIKSCAWAFWNIIWQMEFLWSLRIVPKREEYSLKTFVTHSHTYISLHVELVGKGWNGDGTTFRIIFPYTVMNILIHLQNHKEHIHDKRTGMTPNRRGLCNHPHMNIFTMQI